MEVTVDNKDYDSVIGKLVRLKVWLKPEFHDEVDELIERLVDQAEGIEW